MRPSLRRWLRALGVAIAFPAIAARPAPAPPPAMPANAPWTLRLPEQAAVAFHGDVSYDQAGLGTTPILYPAADPLTLLIGIAAHGATAAALKSSQKTKLQAEADKVLVPYQSVIGTLTHPDLATRALSMSAFRDSGQLASDAADDRARWILEVVPSFAMTKDQQSLVLDNTVALYLPDAAGKPAYANSVRVVSSPRSIGEAPGRWLADDGAPLREESARMLALSVDAFLRDVAGREPAATAPAFRSVRYLAGGAERVERAQVLVETCDRLMLKTLRGWLMSVPVQSTAPACAAPAAPLVEPVVAETAAVPTSAPAPGGDAAATAAP